MSAPVLEAQSVHKRYGGVRAQRHARSDRRAHV